MYIKVKVKTSQKYEEILKTKDDSYIVSVKSAARNGWANSDIKNILVQHFGTNDIRLVSGHTSSAKIWNVEISE